MQKGVMARQIIKCSINLSKKMDQKEFENNAIREILIISLVGLLIFVALVIYGFKIILGL